jgi:hypothetical protein
MSSAESVLIDITEPVIPYDVLTLFKPLVRLANSYIDKEDLSIRLEALFRVMLLCPFTLFEIEARFLVLHTTVSSKCSAETVS